MSTTITDVEIKVTVDVANAVVIAVGNAIVSEAETLKALYLFESASPGDLCKVHGSCATISRLNAVNEQLKWRAHHGSYGHPKDDLTIAAAESTLFEVAVALRSAADAEEPDSPLVERYEGAARSLALAIGRLTAATA